MHGKVGLCKLLSLPSLVHSAVLTLEMLDTRLVEQDRLKSACASLAKQRASARHCSRRCRWHI
jgi:hypothetical protein